jgi:hypothetical protein
MYVVYSLIAQIYNLKAWGLWNRFWKLFTRNRKASSTMAAILPSRWQQDYNSTGHSRLRKSIKGQLSTPQDDIKNMEYQLPKLHSYYSTRQLPTSPVYEHIEPQYPLASPAYSPITISDDNLSYLDEDLYVPLSTRARPSHKRSQLEQQLPRSQLP